MIAIPKELRQAVVEYSVTTDRHKAKQWQIAQVERLIAIQISLAKNTLQKTVSLCYHCKHGKH